MSHRTDHGASRGLGRALARSLAADGWRSSWTPAPPPTGRDRRGLAPADVVAITGDVPTGAPALAGRGRRRRLDLLVLNASRWPVAAAAARRLRLAALRAVLETTRSPAGPDPAGAAGAAGGPRRVLAVSSDAAVGAYGGWGGYGASKPRWTSSRTSSATRSRTCASTRSTRGTCARHAPGRLPGEDTPTGRSRRRWCRALRRLIAADLPSGRYVDAELVGVRHEAPALPARRAPSPPRRRRRAACLGTAYGCWSLRGRRAATAAPTTCRPRCGGRPARHQHLRHPAGRVGGGDRGRRAGRGAPSTVDPAAQRTPASAPGGTPRPLGGRAAQPVHPARRRAVHGDRSGTAVALGRGGRLAVATRNRTPPTRRRLGRPRLATPAPLGRWLTGHGEPVRYGTPPPVALAAYRTGNADTPGSAEMPQRRPPVTSSTFRRLGCAASAPPRWSCTAGCPHRRQTRPRTPSGTRCRGPTLEGGRDPRAGGRVVVVGTTVVRARSRPRAAAGPRAGPTWSSPRATPPSTVRRPADRWAPPRPRTCGCWQPSPTPACWRVVPGALAAGYPAEFGDVPLILP